MLKAVVFDFDGTLTPLTLDFARLRADVMDIARKYAAEEAVKKMEDGFLIEMIYQVAKGLDSKGAQDFEREAFEKLRVLELEGARGKDLYGYARGVLESLKEGGVKIGIITRTSIDVVKTVFTDMDDYISAIVTREDTRSVKPNPAHALEVLAMLDVEPGQAMMVGDHPTDVIGGKAAGMFAAGVLTGRTRREAFEEAGADFIVEDIRAVPRLKAEIQNVRLSHKPVNNTIP